MTVADAPACLPCQMERADGGASVFTDEHWAADIAPGYEVPGWFLLRVRRHAERITGLSDAEIDTFGRRARDLVAAVGEVTQAPATYLVAFGENYPHFHALVIPRDDSVPPHQRSGAILSLLSERRDPAAARALLPAVRAAYARTRTGI